jgi:histidyl-tRNA synthetase
MSSAKPSIPKGTRDFSPEEMNKRNFIFNTLKEVFQLFGYQQIETPAMENLSTLLGKYGEEGDKLLFRILNSGDYLSEVTDEKYQEKNLNQLSALMCEKGLRYDLTVPFARYVVQYRNDITFPFKRYQMQPVWRADRPQKGRYREFYQCDVDVVGSDSLLNEVELIQIIDEGFKKLGIQTVIKLNNRKILSGIAETIGEPDRIIDITIAIDKIDKIGLEKVKEELVQKGLSDRSIIELEKFLKIDQKDNELKLKLLGNLLLDSQTGLKGIEELQTIFNYLKTITVNTNIELDLTLARGLNYYTGAIFEVKALDVQIGSICGGGRYDNLTGIFGLPDVSGVGISFGADRIYDVMNQLNAFPSSTSQSTQVLFINFGEREEMYCLPIVQRLRKEGIKAELFPGSAKMKKQMGYADARKIPFVALIGEEEMQQQLISLKHMTSGEQVKLTLDALIGRLQKQ